jgi:phosphatidylserine decarboxylase
MTMLGTFLKPMHREGYKFLLPALVVSAFFMWLWQPSGWVLLGISVWIYYFFRDPIRYVPENPDYVISPADGVVQLIERAVPPPELEAGREPLLRVSIFMSVFNCHVNRAPVAGEVAKMAYREGKFFNASLDKASSDNERNSLLLSMADGRQIIVVQIAGLVARRIVPFVKQGDRLKAGQRFGLIRFGSRLDVYLPEGVQPLVGVGQTAVAGETVLADLSLTIAPMSVRRD